MEDVDETPTKEQAQASILERQVSCPACNTPIDTPDCETFCRLFAEVEQTRNYRKEECKLCKEVNAAKAEILDSVYDGKSIFISSGACPSLGEDDDGEPIWKVSFSGRKDELAKLHAWLRDS